MGIDIDCIVVGAGVVGLAVARERSLKGREVLILEAAQALGMETSARNSEVIHAGMYYRQGSLKARLCVHGKQLLYDYCESHGIDHQRCGKLIVATDKSQLQTLSAIEQRARNNGVHDLVNLVPSQVATLEPAITCDGALLSPSTGIIDSHGLMVSLLGVAENHKALISYKSPVIAIHMGDRAIGVKVGGSEPMTLAAAEVINCAGHGACALAHKTVGLNTSSVPVPVLAKGSYFQLSGKAPVSKLIYPVPVEGGLGVHVTLDLAGQARFGPDVEWVEKLDYEVNPDRAAGFYEAIRRYWPALADGVLLPDYAGMRPKISKNGRIIDDFSIQGPNIHGIPGLVNLFGIESPGLTASLAIAEYVGQMFETA